MYHNSLQQCRYHNAMGFCSIDVFPTRKLFGFILPHNPCHVITISLLGSENYSNGIFSDDKNITYKSFETDQMIEGRSSPSEANLEF